jgi:hypothetical protein
MGARGEMDIIAAFEAVVVGSSPTGRTRKLPVSVRFVLYSSLLDKKRS